MFTLLLLVLLVVLAPIGLVSYLYSDLGWAEERRPARPRERAGQPAAGLRRLEAAQQDQTPCARLISREA